MEPAVGYAATDDVELVIVLEVLYFSLDESFGTLKLSQLRMDATFVAVMTGSVVDMMMMLLLVGELMFGNGT